MDLFPRKDLPSALGEAFKDAYQVDEEPHSSPWLAKFFRPDSAELPASPLTPEERLLGLATVWSTAKYNFAYWDLLPGETWWDEQFQTYLPRVMDAASDAEHWHLLERFGCLLQDGHTGVYPPAYLRTNRALPAVDIRFVEGLPVIMAGDGLVRGGVILTVDGQPAGEVRQRLRATVATSTPQFADHVSALWLLRGPAGTPVQVTVQEPDGTVRAHTLPRTGPLPPRPPVEIHNLGDGIYHVALNSFSDEETATQFHARFPDFGGVQALILDVRANPGGSSSVGYSILARLLTEPCQAAAVRMPVYVPTFQAWNLSQRWLSGINTVEPDTSRPRFLGPVVALTGPHTCSAAEDFLVGFGESHRGPIIGEPTAGSTGQPLFVPLPGGGAFRVCTKRDTMPDGTPFVGRGIQPDIPCPPTRAGVAVGRDEVLEQALQYLQSSRR